MAQVLNYARLKHIPAGAVYIGRGCQTSLKIRNSKPVQNAQRITTSRSLRQIPQPLVGPNSAWGK